MPGWFQLFNTPSWYEPGVTLPVLNQAWIPLYALFSLIFVISLYHMIRGEWEWLMILPFVINIFSTFVFPLIMLQTTHVALLFAWFDLLVMLCATFGVVGVLWRKSRVLSLLLLPYVVWTLIVFVFQTELVRLNLF
jgi:tryptophan-rich sensory protein